MVSTQHSPASGLETQRHANDAPTGGILSTIKLIPCYRVALYAAVASFFWLSQSVSAGEIEGGQACNPSLVELVGKHFNIANFAYPKDGMYPSVENGGIIISGVCKPWPNDQAKTIAAFAFDAGVEYEKQLIIALVDTAQGRLIASDKSSIDVDAATEVDSYSLALDTARYVLADNIRAFGLRMHTSKERCTYDGGDDDALTLFVVDSESLRPVFGFRMSHWKYGRGNRCGGVKEVVRKDANLFVSVEPTVSKGFADLLITAKANVGSKPLRVKIQYDGKQYKTDALQNAFSRWWDAIVIEDDPAIQLSDAIATSNFAQVRNLLEKGVDVNASSDGEQKLLHEAVYFGNKAMVEFLIDQGADVNAKARMGDTPLHLAAEKGRAEIIELLLARGADINALGYLEVTPLHLAASNKQKDAVALLIAKGANINANKGAGSTPLHDAAMAGSKEIIAMMIEHGADVRARDPLGLTPLHRAVYCGDKQAIELLLSKGSEVDAQDVNLATPLHWAASAGCIEAVKLLLASGADINAQNLEGLTPLRLAAKNKRDEVFQYLNSQASAAVKKSNAGDAEIVKRLFEAARNGNKTLLEELLAKGADVNAREDGRTLAYQAVFSANKALVASLLAKGANANQAGRTGDTPLHGAAANGYSDIVELLLQQNADVNAQNYQGETALHLAAAKGHKDVAELLVARGADINIKDAKRQLPLHLAAGLGNKELVELLLSKKTDVNARDVEDTTPVHRAVNIKSKEIIELLLAKGADINAANRMGTPLHIAVYRILAFQDKLDLVEWLIDKGANINLKPTEGLTELQQAQSAQHGELIKLLKAHGAK